MYVSEVIDISPGNLDFSLCFIQPGISHDVLCIKLNKPGDNIQPWCIPFPIWNQSVVPCPVLTVLSLHFFCLCFVVSRVQLWNSMESSLPGSSIHGTFQERILEWMAISYSRGSSWPRDQTCISCIAGGFSTVEPSGKLHSLLHTIQLTSQSQFLHL